MKTTKELYCEIDRISRFIREYVLEEERIMVPVSGGLDSDVVARLCVKALGSSRVSLFIVRQTHMEEKYFQNVRELADDLGLSLITIELGHMNEQLIKLLYDAAPEFGFLPNSLLDPARANCSLRTAIISSFQDKGYIITGNSNKSERTLGFFMPFGDNLGHIKPIVHLYKSEVTKLATLLGTRKSVLTQSPSAGFWEGEDDLEDLAFWIFNRGPIMASRTFNDDEVRQVMEIKALLSQEKVDQCLMDLETGLSLQEIDRRTNLTLPVLEAIADTVSSAKRQKNRPLMVTLPR